MGHGDEVGGMLFSNESSEEGFSSTRHISLDGHKQDHTVVLHHYQNPFGALSGRMRPGPHLSCGPRPGYL